VIVRYTLHVLQGELAGALLDSSGNSGHLGAPAVMASSNTPSKVALLVLEVCELYITIMV
jgi:hypothetical protein